MVDEAILRKETGQPFRLNLTLKGFPKFKTQVQVNENMLMIFGQLLIFTPFSILFLYITGQILNEKQNQQDKFLQIQGFSKTAYWLSWYLFGLFQILILSSTITLFCNYLDFVLFRNTGLFMFGFLFSVGVGILGQSFLIAALFSQKVGNLIVLCFLLSNSFVNIFFMFPNISKFLQIDLMKSVEMNGRDLSLNAKIQSLLNLMHFCF